MVGIGNLFPFEVTWFPEEAERSRGKGARTRDRFHDQCGGPPDKERSRVCRKALDYIQVFPQPQ